MRGVKKNMDFVKMTGDTDLNFATMMTMRHQGGIDIAPGGTAKREGRQDAFDSEADSQRPA